MIKKRKKLFKNKVSKKVQDQTEGATAIFAAILVLFTTMIDPKISLTIAIVFIILLAIYKFLYH
jgi:hypothetical protein